MREFKVNEYITLKLEYNQTVIYIAGKRFRQCIFVLLNITTEKLISIDEIESVDEAEGNLDKSIETRTFRYNKEMEFPPHVVFWGHCSNMQVWVENNYNTRIIHSKLAFPLLKELTNVGDPIARRVFKQEIIKRFLSGYKPVANYLFNEGYLDYLESEEKENLLRKEGYVIWRGKIIPVISGTLDLSFRSIWNLNEIKGLETLSTLRSLSLKGSELDNIPKWIGNLTALEELDLDRIGFHGNKIDILPSSIGNLSSLRKLTLFNRKLIAIPRTIGNLTSLKILDLSINHLTSLPPTMRNLTLLEELNISSNLLSKIPEWLGDLVSLRKLSINSCLDRKKIEELPNFLKELEKKGVQISYK